MPIIKDFFGIKDDTSIDDIQKKKELPMVNVITYSVIEDNDQKFIFNQGLFRDEDGQIIARNFENQDKHVFIFDDVRLLLIDQMLEKLQRNDIIIPPEFRIVSLGSVTLQECKHLFFTKNEIDSIIDEIIEERSHSTGGINPT